MEHVSKSKKLIAVEQALVIKMITGALIALAVIATFVLGVDQPNPDWHRTWWIRPIVITPLAGATGGLFFHFMFTIAQGNTWQKILFILIGIIGYLFLLWMGIVLGLAGTLWD